MGSPESEEAVNSGCGGVMIGSLDALQPARTRSKTISFLFTRASLRLGLFHHVIDVTSEAEPMFRSKIGVDRQRVVHIDLLFPIEASTGREESAIEAQTQCHFIVIHCIEPDARLFGFANENIRCNGDHRTKLRQRMRVCDATRDVDRKSTRLNSSH